MSINLERDRGNPHRPKVNRKASVGEPMAFIREVVKSPPDTCVNWPYSKMRSGHGGCTVSGKVRPAHSVALSEYQCLEHTPRGVCALHDPLVCNNPSCVNPKHIRWGSNEENTKDKKIAGTHRWGNSDEARTLAKKRAEIMIPRVEAGDRAALKILNAIGSVGGVVSRTERWLRTAIKDADPNRCIEWPFAKSKTGHGKISKNGKVIGPHRLALCIHEGRDAPPEGMWCAHAPIICHNPSCVNPYHLRWATPKENHNDMVIDGTDKIAGLNGRTILDPQKVREIRKSTEASTVLGEKHGVSRRAIEAVQKRETWAWVED